MIPRKEWRYKGMEGHFILNHLCRWRICTDIGHYRISSVGALYLKSTDKFMSEIGCDRHYETFVFRLKNAAIVCHNEIDCDATYFDKDKDDPYETDKIAEAMHDKMCRKYARIAARERET